MEQHPIPQDITGFQFKLIGEMTIKQFAYVAVGAIIGWLFYISPIFLIIKIILAVFFVGGGVALAFIPIQGRPMDAMIANFFKAIFTPTQYVYQKQGARLFSDNISNPPPDQLKQFLDKLPKGKDKLDQKESVFFQNLNNYATNPQEGSPAPQGLPSHYYATLGGTQQQVAGSPIQQSPDQVLASENLTKTAAVLEKEIQEAKVVEAKQTIDPQAVAQSHQKVLELQKDLNDMLSQKQDLEKRLTDLQKNITQGQQPVFTASIATETPRETKNVRSIPQSMTKSVGLPAVSEFPNLLSGIIKDPRGNPLSNILVEVKDEEGNAVRAFKTNALGQFSSATSLTNGSYTIEFEDPKAENQFDTVAFQATGQIIMPMEVISSDKREELRRTLFN